jgi:hypothetical protein
LKKMTAVDGVEKPAAVLLNQSIVQANCDSDTIAFVLRLFSNSGSGVKLSVNFPAEPTFSPRSGAGMPFAWWRLVTLAD